MATTVLRKAAFLGCRQTMLKSIVRCQIGTSAMVQSKSSINFTRKFLLQNDGSKKRRVWHDGRMIQSPSDLDKPHGKSVISTRRLRVLNKVFMDKITEVMSTGEISAQLSGIPIEVSEVKVLPNFLGINVHWICTGTEADNQIEEILQKNAKQIRHILSQLYNIGHIPPITFVKDHRVYKLQEVERRLAVADFGDGFIPSDPVHHLKSSLVLNTKLNDNLKETINDLEVKTEDAFAEALKMSLASPASSDELVDDIPPLDLPAMRNDVLGVDTQKIYKMVQQRLVKARADHRYNQSVQECSSESLEETGDLYDTVARTKEIHQWANKYHQLCKREFRSKNEVEYLWRMSLSSSESVEEEESAEEEEDYFNEEFDLYDK
ncbi:hypothetical protein OTU49_015836 [Cherax quadricarinatus]|uniref:Ribosome-binding factor A, mitochondrial n=1 Tax=Cherax quadricarinatus TaxID=27406 RepID=A0AAW0XVF8_CHEQU|nr:uncharacterized protein LOC128687669 [Cherax quadricarinatus]